MSLDPSALVPYATAAAGLWALARAARSLYVVAQPDEWLLCIRDGRLASAGVGVTRLRRPGDVVVRFSSTMQRVGFAVDALTVERVPARVEGFVFWSVSDEGDAPFRAYSRLGIANLLQPPPMLRHPRHLLTSPQHKAFQQILSAVVQRHVSTLALGAVVGQQDALVAGLAARLREVTSEMGVRIDQVEILAARPLDAAVQGQLSAAESERLREEAARVRREVASRIAAADADAEHALASRARELARDRALAAEADALELSRQRAAREREEEEQRLARQRAAAEAERDCELARAEALERKSPAVREHERAVLVAEKVAASLRVTDARWVSVGAESPAASVGAMLAGVRAMLEPKPAARDEAA